MRTEWKSLGIQLHHIFGLPISPSCQIVLYILADSSDGFNPSVSTIASITQKDRGNISKRLKELEKHKYIIKAGKDPHGRSKWLINTETIRPLVSHLTSCCENNSQIASCCENNRGVVVRTTGVLSSEQHKPLNNPKINPKEVAREALPSTSQYDNGDLDTTKVTSPKSVTTSQTDKAKKKTKKKAAKKVVKSKPSQKARITTWEPDHPYSKIFTLLCSLEPYKAVFDLSRDIEIIDKHMTVQNWNIAQMTYIVRLFVSKSIGSEGGIKSARGALATYVGNGEKYNSAELAKLNNQTFQGDYI
jgi:hypothetical protein